MKKLEFSWHGTDQPEKVPEPHKLFRMLKSDWTKHRAVAKGEEWPVASRWTEQSEEGFPSTDWQERGSFASGINLRLSVRGGQALLTPPTRRELGLEHKVFPQSLQTAKSPGT